MAEQDLGLELSQGIAYIRKLQELVRSLAHSRPMKALRERVSLNFLARATVAAESVCVLLVLLTRRWVQPKSSSGARI
jgi:hypothetical protein